MALTLVPLASLTVTAVTNKAAGILTFAATTGVFRGAWVSVQTASGTGWRCKVIAVTSTTLTLVSEDDYRLGKTSTNLANAAISDVVVQEEQMVNLKPWEVPVSVATPVRTT